MARMAACATCKLRDVLSAASLTRNACRQQATLTEILTPGGARWGNLWNKVRQSAGKRTGLGGNSRQVMSNSEASEDSCQKEGVTGKEGKGGCRGQLWSQGLHCAAQGSQTHLLKVLIGWTPTRSWSAGQPNGQENSGR